MSSSGKGKATVTDVPEHDHHAHSHEHSHSHEHEHEHHAGCGHSHAHAHAHGEVDLDDAPALPIVRAREVAEAMERREHFMGRAVRVQACLSDLAGMSASGLGVHLVTLPPNSTSTELHSHLAESEWLYILTGRATLVLARPIAHNPDDLRPAPEGLIEVREETLEAGDFAGFPAGHPGDVWAHKLRSGGEAVTYLLGGERKGLDVISYPTHGKTLVSHEESGAEAMFEGRAEPAAADDDDDDDDDDYGDE